MISGIKNIDPIKKNPLEIGVKFDKEEIQEIWREYC